MQGGAWPKGGDCHRRPVTFLSSYLYSSTRISDQWQVLGAFDLLLRIQTASANDFQPVQATRAGIIHHVLSPEVRRARHQDHQDPASAWLQTRIQQKQSLT
jgi:hypothetical protein